MTVIGFHASHEQIHPSQLLRDVQAAEQAGFGAAMCSDHFSPWSARQGQSGFAWSWLGAAMATTSIPFGVVNAPGERYHPAIIAQAMATLGAMFPGRFWAALGSGEAINEHITGHGWPRKEVRNARLRESVSIIRALLHGEEVSHSGHVTVDRARLWTLADPIPGVILPAVTVETARDYAFWADGLITVNQPLPHLRRMIEAYREAGGRGPILLQVHLAWAPTHDEAMVMAHQQWRTNVFRPPVCWDLDHVSAFDEVSQGVSPEQVSQSVLVSADLMRHAEQLAQYADLGFDEIFLHHVGTEQAAFIDAFGSKVLPEVTG